MRQVWLAPEIIQRPEFEVDGEAYHYFFSVLRFVVGEEFEAISGLGMALRVQVIEVGKKKARLRIVSERELTKLPSPKIGLAFCLPKFPVFEDILEKIVEMGIFAVQPLISERSFIKTDRDVSPSRWDRWQRIVESASAQSQRAELVEIRPIQNLRSFVAGFPAGGFNQSRRAQCLLAYEGSQQELRPILQEIKSRNPNEIWYLIGPEGGFSEPEAVFLGDCGIPQVSLGPLILRTDSACFTLLSILKYELGILK